MKLEIKASTSELSKSLADFIIKESSSSIEEHGSFRIAISGGSLPQLAFSELIKDPFQSKVDWSKWHVFFVGKKKFLFDQFNLDFLLKMNDISLWIILNLIIMSPTKSC